MRKSHHGSHEEKLKLKAVRVTAVFKASLGKIVRRVR